VKGCQWAKLSTGFGLKLGLCFPVGAGGEGVPVGKGVGGGEGLGKEWASAKDLESFGRGKRNLLAMV